MRDIFIAAAAIDTWIGTTPEPSPAIVRNRIFGIHDKVDRAVANERTWKTEVNGAASLNDIKLAGVFAIAPAPRLPPAQGRSYFAVSQFGRQKQVRLKRQEHGRSFRVSAEGKDGCADLPMSAEGKVDILGVFAATSGTKADRYGRPGDINVDCDIVGAGDRFGAQTNSLSGST